MERPQTNFFDTLKKLFLGDNTKNASADALHTDRHLVQDKFSVVGVDYYLKNIQKLACKNPDWAKNKKTLIAQNMAGAKVFRYYYINKPVKLIEEPRNPHDKNAIMVQIAGELVGYISMDDNVYVKKVLSTGNVKFVSAFIFGGPYKCVLSDGEMYREEDLLSICVKIGHSVCK